mgnify:CR=1 FL=1
MAITFRFWQLQRTDSSAVFRAAEITPDLRSSLPSMGGNPEKFEPNQVAVYDSAKRKKLGLVGDYLVEYANGELGVWTRNDFLRLMKRVPSSTTVYAYTLTQRFNESSNTLEAWTIYSLNSSYAGASSAGSGVAGETTAPAVFNSIAVGDVGEA